MEVGKREMRERKGLEKGNGTERTEWMEGGRKMLRIR